VEHLSQMAIPDHVALGDEMKGQLDTPSPVVTIAGENVVVTPERIGAVDTLIDVRQRESSTTGEREKKETTSPYVLGTLDNTDDVTWTARLMPRHSAQPDMLPKAIQTPLKQHQLESFNWQVAA